MTTKNDETQTDEAATPADESQTETSTQTTEDTAAADASAETVAAAEDAPQPGEEAGKKGESLADAINEAIEGAGPKKVAPKAEAEETAAELEAQGRNPDGTFKEKAPEQKKAEEDAAAAAKKPAAEEDPINDPIPDAIKGRTRERMQKLIDTVKAQTEIAEQHDALFGTIQATGATPEEFAAMVGYMRAVHSNDPKDLEQAYNVLREELVGIAIKLGRPVPEVNLLREKGNEDLIKEIQDGTLTVNRAHEISIQRAAAARSQQQNQAKTQADRTTQDAATIKQQGINELNDLDKVLRAQDGNEVFDYKYAKLTTPEMKEYFQTLDPRTWVPTFKRLYSLIEVPAATVAPTVKPAAPKPRPMRPSAPAGGGGASPAQPKSALEALNAALEGM